MDEVVLTLPAAPEFVRLARLTCAGLATRIGMGYDEVEDLRIAVGEACSLLIGGGDRAGTLTITFGVSDKAITVTVTGDVGEPLANDDASALSDQILAAVVDDHRVDLAGAEVWIVKQATGEVDGADPA